MTCDPSLGVIPHFALSILLASDSKSRIAMRQDRQIGIMAQGIVLYVNNGRHFSIDFKYPYTPLISHFTNPTKEGATVTRQTKLIKWTMVLLLGLMLGVVAVYHFMYDPVPESFVYDSSPLAWSAPEQYEDDSPLTDLSEYKIYCWNATKQRTLVIEVDDPESTTFDVENFAPGTYQCAMKAVSEQGGESGLSNVVTRIIPR